LHVLDARTGGECQYPKDNALGLQFNFWRGWLPDGRLVTLDAAGELVALDRPCGGNMVLLSAEEKPACLMTNPDASESCSPGDTRRGITLGSGAAYTTTVVNVSTGKAEAVIPWQFSADGLGSFPATNSPFLFSPDNHFLAAIGWVSQKPETALFVFELRP